MHFTFINKFASKCVKLFDTFIPHSILITLIHWLGRGCLSVKECAASWFLLLFRYKWEVPLHYISSSGNSGLSFTWLSHKQDSGNMPNQPASNDSFT